MPRAGTDPIAVVPIAPGTASRDRHARSRRRCASAAPAHGLCRQGDRRSRDYAAVARTGAHARTPALPADPPATRSRRRERISTPCATRFGSSRPIPGSTPASARSTSRPTRCGTDREPRSCTARWRGAPGCSAGAAYGLDALNWRDRARANFLAWLPRQNVGPVPPTLPPPTPQRPAQRAGLHSNACRIRGDMGTVFIDALFRHLAWTGDIGFAFEAWPASGEHPGLAAAVVPPALRLWSGCRCTKPMRRSGRATTSIMRVAACPASACNLYHNRQAARIARAWSVKIPHPMTAKRLIGRAMRARWLPGLSRFAEYRQRLAGRRAVHPGAGLWSYYPSSWD